MGGMPRACPDGDRLGPLAFVGGNDVVASGHNEYVGVGTPDRLMRDSPAPWVRYTVTGNPW